MKRAFAILLLLLAPATRLPAAEPLQLEEVLGIVRSNLTGVTATELNQATLAGLLEQLSSRVVVVTNTPDTPASPLPLVARTNLFEGGAGYLRVGRVAPGLAANVAEALRQWTGTNALQGLVLDLRFAGGDDYAEAGRVADLFIAGDEPLLDWGSGQASAVAKTNAFDRPVVLLVNKATAGAAEALAGALREARVALLVGAPTAGQAQVFREFPLSNGQQLRVAVAPVKIGRDGAISREGLSPDLVVGVPATDELGYLEDPLKPASSGKSARAGGTNRSPRLTEADLVRLHRDGIDPAVARARPADAPLAQIIYDPALARALDILKGLALVPGRKS